jgi:hypothetical protein
LEHPTWTEQLPEAMRTEENYKIFDQYEKLGDFTSDFIKVKGDLSSLSGERDELKGKVGTFEQQLAKMVAIPGEEATDEEKKAFYEKFGVPESIEGYGFEDLAKDELGKKALEGFKDAKLNKSQAKKMAEFVADFGEVQKKMVEESAAKSVNEYKESLGDKADLVFKNATDAVAHFFNKEDADTAIKTVMSDPKQIEVFSRIGGLIKESPRIFSQSKTRKGGGVMYESMKDLD